MKRRTVWQGKANDCACRVWTDEQYVNVQWLRPDGSAGLYPQRSDGSVPPNWDRIQYLAIRTALLDLDRELRDTRVAAIDIDEVDPT